jgi:hypothetical protein
MAKTQKVERLKLMSVQQQRLNPSQKILLAPRHGKHPKLQNQFPIHFLQL